MKSLSEKHIWGLKKYASVCLFYIVVKPVVAPSPFTSSLQNRKCISLIKPFSDTITPCLTVMQISYFWKELYHLLVRDLETVMLPLSKLSDCCSNSIGFIFNYFQLVNYMNSQFAFLLLSFQLCVIFFLILFL